jgi:hypothetical protein
MGKPYLRSHREIILSSQITNMKQISYLFISIAWILIFSGCRTACANPNEDPEQTRWFWGFDKWNDTEGWTLPGVLNGTVSGGAMWLTIQTEKTDSVKSWRSQIWGSAPNYMLVSPGDLKIPADRYNTVVIRLRNLSPETDGFVSWQADKKGEDAGYVRFTMKPDCREWQEVVCHMDSQWKGTIDRIKILPAQMWRRGDIWIDWIAVAPGEAKPARQRPDVCSAGVVPQIKLPGIAQRDFEDAFKVLDECIVTDVPLNGFNYPYMAPGGAYGSNWWQLDGSLNVAGAKWTNRKFTEDIIRGFAEVQMQNPDGRIDLWGGSTTRGQVADVSSLPKYFEAAYDVFRRSDDSLLRVTIFESVKNYLGYWFSPAKRDRSTGLITGVFEEALSNITDEVGALAPVDLNVEVAIGCYNASRMASCLGKAREAGMFLRDFKELSESINQYMWSEDDRVYCNYNVHEKKIEKRLLCTTFDPMQLGIAPADRVEKLIPVLLNPSLFNWGTRPLTTIARTEPGYVEATGVYDGRAWFGDIWTLRNLPVINGLEDAGKHGLAAELAWSTIKTFNSNYCEFIVPATGSGEGVQRYGWSASQYIQAIIENLFGIDYDSQDKRLRIVPHLAKELFRQEIGISNLVIPCENDLRLDLKIKQTKEGKAIITIKLRGKLPDEMLEIGLPSDRAGKVTITDNTGKRVLPLVQIEDLKGVTGIKLGMRDYIELNFE